MKLISLYVESKDDLLVSIVYETKGIEYFLVIARRTKCNRSGMIWPVVEWKRLCLLNHAEKNNILYRDGLN